MQLTEADLREFSKIWFREFQEKITDEEARLAASMLLDLYFLMAAFRSEDFRDVIAT
ncbi:MAG: hypothetical protein ACR2IF_07130 [Terriglobales bacterium]